MKYYNITTQKELTYKEALDILLTAYQDTPESRELLSKPSVVPCCLSIIKITRNVIFLDIDGVLNTPDTEEHIGKIPGVEDEKLALLKELVDYTGSDLILISSWKTYWDKALIKDGTYNWFGSSKKRYGRYLNVRFAEHGLEIKDKTEEKHWSLRAEGVKDYISNQENIIILDDEDFDWGELSLFWVDTSDKGLTPKLVEEIKASFDKGKFKIDSGND